MGLLLFISRHLYKDPMRINTLLISVILFNLVCICVYSYERQSLGFNSFSEVADEIENIYQVMQKKQHKIFDRIPNVNEMQNGELVISKVGTTVKLYCRVQSSTYSLTMSN